MPSQDKQSYVSIEATSMSPVQKFAMLAILVAAAAALQIIESPLPRVLPWLKPGLANVLTLYAILRISFKAGIGVAVLRTFIAGIFLGSIFSPVHIISLAGSLSSALIMSITRKVLPETGLSTVSVAGAMASNVAQLVTVQLMFASQMSLWFHAAIMVWVAIPSGLIVAKATSELLRRT